MVAEKGRPSAIDFSDLADICATAASDFSELAEPARIFTTDLSELAELGRFFLALSANLLKMTAQLVPGSAKLLTNAGHPPLISANSLKNEERAPTRKAVVLPLPAIDLSELALAVSFASRQVLFRRQLHD